ncbi:hypothetical protein JCM21738_5472 [Mesobacillus boroniphilus JCM 21738]|uniref:Uncharacterized protein n=1 Tax=Mesobacillus boroniphilus JCM 21738 TaxID=1294265 RepID=W4RWV4_9BACI|nr:hypothetical protein JCM21738_5472 [Mesobacillus boroniphilus JCM 21738]
MPSSNHPVVTEPYTYKSQNSGGNIIFSQPICEHINRFPSRMNYYLITLQYIDFQILNAGWKSLFTN